jgi:hypothetical protein
MNFFILEDECFLDFTINNENAHRFWDSEQSTFYTVEKSAKFILYYAFIF